MLSRGQTTTSNERDMDDDLSPGKREQMLRFKEKLERELGPQILGFLASDDVVEIMLNPNRTLWVERMGHSPELFGTMSPSNAERLMAAVATMLQTKITRDSPYLECELPFDGSRFEAILPPVTSGPVFTIRRRPSKIWTLDNYVRDKVLDETQKVALQRAVEDRQNILVVGGTGSGKTTLANALIAHMSAAVPNDRLVIIEDTVEIQCSSPNYVFLKTTPRIAMQELLSITMRLRPDRIIVGEVRGREALTIIKAWNTGHPGGLATIHANSARSGLTRLQALVAEATAEPMQEFIAEAVNLIVFINKVQKSEDAPAGRRVQQLLRVDGFRDGAYLTTPIGG